MSSDPYAPKRIVRPRPARRFAGGFPVDRLLRLGASTSTITAARANLDEITDPVEREAALAVLSVADDTTLRFEIAELERDLRAEREPIPNIDGTAVGLVAWVGEDAERAARVLNAERDRATDAGKPARAGLVRAMERIIRG